MAFSPCPRCQSKQEFDELKLRDVAFVVVKSPYSQEFYANDYVCTRVPEHVWHNFGDITVELRKAGY